MFQKVCCISESLLFCAFTVGLVAVAIAVASCCCCCYSSAFSFYSSNSCSRASVVQVTHFVVLAVLGGNQTDLLVNSYLPARLDPLSVVVTRGSLVIRPPLHVVMMANCK